MKRTLVLPFILLAAYCGSSSGPASVSLPGHGAITIAVVPNPILAQKVSGDMYRFPFDVIVRETGGHPVSITRVSADVRAIAGIRVATESYDAAKINSLGFSTKVGPNGEIRYHFAPEDSVPDDRLFGGVTAELTGDGVDETGTTATARTTVTVRR
ncbi:MAG: hypothetical protein ACXVJO_15625 [Thermoanaerobaculia bacterium]